MCRFVAMVAVAIAILRPTATSPAQEKRAPTRAIGIHTPNGWILEIHSDGSGLLQCGPSGGDGWPFPAGTLDVARATKDLRALPSDPKGGRVSHYTVHFESERESPDKSGPARNTRDAKVIPALLKSAAAATRGWNEFDAARRAELLKQHPLGKLPNEK
jgi:hypothetical protein